MKADSTKLEILSQSPFGEDAVFHHIGLGVASIDLVSPQSTPIEDPIQRVRVAFISLNGVTVELVEPLGEDSPIQQSLDKGSKLLHLCYTVPDLDLALEHAKQFGFRCIHKPVPAVAFENNRIAWVFSLQFGLIELLEEKCLENPD